MRPQSPKRAAAYPATAICELTKIGGPSSWSAWTAVLKIATSYVASARAG